MRVALVQCPAWGALPPLGPAALKGYLNEHGYEARCFDLNIQFHNAHRTAQRDTSGAAYGGADPWGADSYDQWSLDYRRWDVVRFQEGSPFNDDPLPLDDWADQVLAWDPEVIGFTIYMTSLASSLQLAERIKERKPSATIVFGGPNVASDREGRRALQTGIPDLVVDGEGEQTLLAVVQALDEGESVRHLPGLGMLVDGEVVWTDKRPLIPKVDSLPFPDFTDYDWTAYPNPYQIPIMSSRGCVLQCSFCYETVYWKRFRTQSPARIVAEMAHQVATHPLRDQAEAGDATFYFMFADSLVNGHIAGLRRMAQLIIDEGLDVGWGGQATINKKMDKEYCELLAQAGCKGLAFGLESGSQRVLEKMGKHFHIDDAPTMMRDMHDAGITLTMNVMVGFPTETRMDFVRTLLFLAKTRRWINQVSNVATTQIALGTDLYLFPEKYGVVVHPDNSWTSEETGTEKDRYLRLRILHGWMKLLRIAHQNIGPSPELADLGDEPLPPEVASELAPEEVLEAPADDLLLEVPSPELIAEIGAGHAGAPMELISLDGTVVDVQAPEWAAWLEPQSWVGVPLDDLSEKIMRATGGTLDVEESDPPGPGVQSFTIAITTADTAQLLRVYEFGEAESDRRRLLLHAN